MAALVYTEPDGRLATWRDRKRYLWLLALIPSSATFIAVGLVTATGWNVFWWTGPLIAFALIPVIDILAGEDGKNPPDEVIDELRERPLLPVVHLRLSAAAVHGLLPVLLHLGALGSECSLQYRARSDDRRDGRNRHQHRPRTRAQEGERRALVVQNRSRTERLRPLLPRAQPWPPCSSVDSGRSGYLALR